MKLPALSKRERIRYRLSIKVDRVEDNKKKDAYVNSDATHNFFH